MLKNKIINQAKHLLDQAIFTCDLYIVYTQLNEYRLSKNELLNKSPAFFNIVIRSIINSLVIETGKLIEDVKDKETFSCKLLLNKCKINISQIEQRSFSPTEFLEIKVKPENKDYKTLYFKSFKDFLEKTEKDFIDCEAIMKNIYKQRSKIYVHNDNKIIDKIDDITNKYFISFLDIKKCLLACINFCNGINSYFNNSTSLTCCINSNDLNNILGIAEIGELYKEQ